MDSPRSGADTVPPHSACCAGGRVAKAALTPPVEACSVVGACAATRPLALSPCHLKMLRLLTAALSTPPAKWALAPAPLRIGLMGLVSLLLATFGQAALAQTPPSATASAPIADHVKRAAERPFYWIRLNAQPGEGSPQRPKPPIKPAPRAAPTGAAMPASAAAARAASPPARPEPVAVAPALAASEPSAPDASTALLATLDSDPPTAGLSPAAPLPPAASASAPDTVPEINPLTNAPVAAAPAPGPVPATSNTASAPTLAANPQALKLLSQVEPEFPTALQRRLREGSVEVGFTVLPDGSVSAPSVLRSSHPRLEAAALAAVAQWRFEPIATPKPGVVEVGFKLDP